MDLSTDTERSRSNLRMPEVWDLSCRCASEWIARLSCRLWAMVPSDGAPRTKGLAGGGDGMSGVIVRLKSGVEGLSRCRIASTEHMFSMGATDMLNGVAAL